MNLQFTEVSQRDIPAILAQAKELIDAYEDLTSIDYDKVMIWMERKISQNIFRYRCVLKDQQPCAYYCLCEDGELDDFYVLPAFRNMGIGSEIMRKCIAESVNPLYLYVFTRNTGAISFYKRFGFTCCKTVSKTRMILARNG